MKYFAKYLPVEGEIDCWCHKIDAPDRHSCAYYNYENNCTKKKLKLFLCSRDIQVGDKYFNTTVNEWDICDSETRLEQIREYEERNGKVRIKVIGEISPEATFVKDGDQFKEDEFYISSPDVPGFDTSNCGELILIKNTDGRYY